jgi:hypothetical protein
LNSSFLLSVTIMLEVPDSLSFQAVQQCERK